MAVTLQTHPSQSDVEREAFIVSAVGALADAGADVVGAFENRDVLGVAVALHAHLTLRTEMSCADVRAVAAAAGGNRCRVRPVTDLGGWCRYASKNLEVHTRHEHVLHAGRIRLPEGVRIQAQPLASVARRGRHRAARAQHRACLVCSASLVGRSHRATCSAACRRALSRRRGGEVPTVADNIKGASNPRVTVETPNVIDSQCECDARFAGVDSRQPSSKSLRASPVEKLTHRSPAADATLLLASAADDHLSDSPQAEVNGGLDRPCGRYGSRRLGGEATSASRLSIRDVGGGGLCSFCSAEADPHTQNIGRETADVESVGLAVYLAAGRRTPAGGLFDVRDDDDVPELDDDQADGLDADELDGLTPLEVDDDQASDDTDDDLGVEDLGGDLEL